jgi:hypothetical protein
MKDFDKEIKSKIQGEKIVVPINIHQRIENTLDSLPEITEKPKSHIFQRISAAVACFVFVTLLLLPNVSTGYAEAASKIPVIGELVEVLTLRNYFYSDDRHEMNIDVLNISDAEAKQAAERINMNIDELTHELVGKFYDEVELDDNGYGSIYVDYEIVTNSKEWFTLKLTVTQTSGSSNTYYKFYHINRKTGNYIELHDLFNSDEYRERITDNIKEQIEAQMKADKNKVYFSNDIIAGEEFVSIDKNQNFYINKNNNLVIVFDKYEIAPGSMGCPEFVINKNVFYDILKDEMKGIIK